MIKKLLITIVALILLPAFAWASPFLTCDPQAGITSYDVEINGIIVATNVTPETNGSINYDLSGQTPGPYMFRLKAFGEGDYPSDWSLPFDATKPGNPGNVRISP